MKKKVLLVGGAGYIGSILQQTEQHEYFVYDLVNGDDARKPIHLKYKPDVIVDLAAFKDIPEGESNPGKYYHNNCSIPLNLSRLATLLNIPVIFLSSAAVYGHSEYGFTKSIGEAIYSDCPQPVTSMRLQNVYGCGGNGVVTAINEAKKNNTTFTINGSDYQTADGTPARDYVHVDDVCGAINSYIDKTYNYIFDFGTGQETTVKELCDYAGVDYDISDRRDGDVGNCYAAFRNNPLLVYPEKNVKEYFDV